MDHHAQRGPRDLPGRGDRGVRRCHRRGRQASGDPGEVPAGRAYRRTGQHRHPRHDQRASAPAVLRQGGHAGGRADAVRAAPVHLPVVRRPHRGRHARLRAARRRRDDPVRHDAVRGAGLQPPRRRARVAGRLRYPGPDRSVDVGPGGPGRSRRAARLAADGRRLRAGPPEGRHSGRPQVQPPADPRRRHDRGRGHLLGRPQPGRGRPGPRVRQPVRPAQVDQRGRGRAGAEGVRRTAARASRRTPRRR
jgi:hypothetical protein